MTLQVITDSALCDKLTESLRMVMTEQFPIPGDHYYNAIDVGILTRQPIIISMDHLPKDLVEQLLSHENSNDILFKVVKQIFAEKFGNSLAYAAVKEGRINIQFGKPKV